MTRILVFSVWFSITAGLASPTIAETFDEATEGLQRQDGLITTYVDKDQARVLLDLKDAGDGTFGRYVYAGYLTGGLGSNPLGLDRSLPTDSYVLAFRQAGENMVAEIENHRFRATADNPSEQRAVATSFARSIIWSTPIIAMHEEGALIDFSSFLLRDAVGVGARLKRAGEGAYKVSKNQSYVETEAAFTFETNLEFDAHVTLTGTNPGREVRGTTPVPSAITLLMHTSLIKLPEPGFVSRRSDERAGLVTMSHVDMSAPLDGNTVVEIARRYRLQKGADGKVIKPIIFYIDNGAPEPIRTALLEGAQWWAEAFEAAGFPGGYRAEILPEGVHPLDARYSVVNWVHRATRGWSYGTTVSDPRTGEVIRGVVLLGSLRVRQDIKIFEALAGADKTGTGAADDPVQVALARIRQLSAHEIGHALGFAHNMAASSYGRESVMDYPAPDIRLAEGGAIDFSSAYDVGMGEWDKWATNFLYGEYPDKDRDALFKDAADRGLVYVADGDSRSPGTGHIRGSLWDNGNDAVEELTKVMALRSAAIRNFGANVLRDGEPYFALQTKFVPLYLYHRYQTQAAAKFIGGYDFAYRAEGDGRPETVAVPWSEQTRAFEVLIETLSPEALLVPEQIQMALSPLGQGGGDPQFRRETFSRAAAPLFSLEEAVSSAADVTLGALLHPARLQRLAEQELTVPGHEGVEGVTDRLWKTMLNAKRGENPGAIAVRAVVLGRLSDHMVAALQNPSTGTLVRTAIRESLTGFQAQARRTRGEMADYAKLLATQIEDRLAQARTPAVKRPAQPAIPPGSPIGASDCWHCSP